MKKNSYLKHYRLRDAGEVLPASISECGPARTFKAVDSRSGAPVLLTLVPVDHFKDEEREKFEEHARAIVQFDHAHVARAVDFGRDGDEYAFVSEYPRGETTEEWVHQHGRMPPEAVLRIALQIVSAIGAAAFHQIVHTGIRPSNILISPGQIAEGGWPSIKLMNLATGGLGLANIGSESVQFASPEQLRDGTADFRSEIYSLGASMCFLLTGVFYSAEPRSLQTRRFARPLRKLIQPMLRQDPKDRPQDPIVITETLRNCLEAVERRERVSQRFGLPFLAVRTRAPRVKMPTPQAKPQPTPLLAASEVGGPEPVSEWSPSPEPIVSSRSRRWSPAFAIAAAALLGMAIIGAAAIPFRHYLLAGGQSNTTEQVGKAVGVSQPAPVWEGKPLVMNRDRIPNPPPPKTVAESSPVPAPANVAESSPLSTGKTLVQASPQPFPPSEKGGIPAPALASLSASPPAVAQADEPSPAAPAEGPQSVWERTGDRPLKERVARKDAEANADDSEPPARRTVAARHRDVTDESPDRAASSNTSERNDADEDSAPPKTQRAVPARNRRTLPATPAFVNHSRGEQAAIARVASDGSVVLRFADGQVAVIPAQEGERVPVRRTHRVRRRYYIQRRSVDLPEQPAPGYPYDRGD